MRLGNPSTQRPVYYDRAPLAATVGADSINVAPHGLTTRATYTVPAARKGIVTNVYLQITRQTVAAPKGRPRVNLSIAAFTQALLELTENVADKTIALAWTPQYVLLPAQVLNLQTSDDSTGGTLDYETYAGIMEFDV